MRFLFLGDIVAKPGRTVVLEHLPRLRDQLKLDFVVANTENAAHGFGLTEKICDELFEAGVDVMTTGNHVYDKAEIIPFMEQDTRVIRPDNYPAGAPGRGSVVYDSPSGHRVLVVNVMGRVFMEPLDNPFVSLDRLVPPGTPVENGLDAVLVDVHAEATSEKYVMGHYLDGRASLVVGTHTHVPTADYQILAGGTGYQTDAGMCGAYDSVIGMNKEDTVERTSGRIPKPRLTPAEGEATLCGVLVETDPKTGLARSISPLRVGGRLRAAWPE